MIQRLAITSIKQSSRMTQLNAYNFIPASCYQISQKVNPVLKVTLGNSQSNFFTLNFRLFENIVPKTAENFRRLLLGNASYCGNHLSLIGTGIKRHIPMSFIEMGHMQQDKNCSIYGKTFRDQSFELLHDRPGLLSSVSNQNTNSSPFLITLAPCPFLDYKNVVFGEIDPQSMQNLRRLEREIAKYNNLHISAVQELALQANDHFHGHQLH